MNDGTVKYFFSVDSKARPPVILIDLWLGLILLAHKEGLRLADILRRRPDDAMGECWSVQVSPSDDKYCVAQCLLIKSAGDSCCTNTQSPGDQNI